MKLKIILCLLAASIYCSITYASAIQPKGSSPIMFRITNVNLGSAGPLYVNIVTPSPIPLSQACPTGEDEIQCYCEIAWDDTQEEQNGLIIVKMTARTPVVDVFETQITCPLPRKQYENIPYGTIFNVGIAPAKKSNSIDFATYNFLMRK